MNEAELKPLEPGEIVQIGDTHPNVRFHYCLMVVSEPKSWGAQGYVVPPGRAPDVVCLRGIPLVRVKHEDMHRTGGKVRWEPLELIDPPPPEPPAC